MSFLLEKGVSIAMLDYRSVSWLKALSFYVVTFEHQDFFDVWKYLNIVTTCSSEITKSHNKSYQSIKNISSHPMNSWVVGCP